MKNLQIKVVNEDKGVRIDKYLTSHYEDVSRSHLQKWIEDGDVTINGKHIKSNYKVRENDVIDINEPDVKEVEIVATKMDLDIIYEDSDIMIINKPIDMVVHPAPGHYNDTLVNGIMYHCKDDLSGINGELRPGIVHRIDKDTTGLLVVCKNDKAHVHVADQFKAHTIDRVYEAIIFNNPSEDEGFVEGPIGRHHTLRRKMAINYRNGKDAKTHYKVIEHLKDGFTHIELKLETGRTHQIRVHMTSIGHPLLGDTLYGPKSIPFNLPGQMLHAKTLGLIHPSTLEYISFSVEPPEIFKLALDRLRN